MGLAYAIDREAGTVTVYGWHDVRVVRRFGLPSKEMHDRCAEGIILDESDLITLLSDLRLGTSQAVVNINARDLHRELLRFRRQRDGAG